MFKDKALSATGGTGSFGCVTKESGFNACKILKS